MSDHAATPHVRVPVHRVVADVTERVIARSRETRTAYLSRISQAATERGGRPTRADLGCSNLAHAVASCGGSRSRCARRQLGREHRHRHVVQRHALRARALRDLPAADQGDRPLDRWCRTGRGRCARHVRRDHPGPGGHGAEPVQPRRHRDVRGDRPVPRRLRRRADARRLRQDRARARGGRPRVRAPAHGAGPGRPDVLGPAERREGRRPPRARRRQGRPRGAAGRRGGVLPLAGHVHVLRHRELQPAADGRDGPAPARCRVRPPRQPAAGRADRRRHAPGGRDRLQRRRLRHRRHRRREGRGQRGRGAARDRRLDQPHHAPRHDGRGRRRPADLGGLRRPVAGRPAAGPDVPQRPRRREPLPRGRRHARSSSARWSTPGCCTRTC